MAKRIAIAIESTPNGEAQVSEHFGKCTAFQIYSLDDDNKVVEEKVEKNSLEWGQSSACSLPPYVKQFNVDVIIAGGMGMKAITQFNQFGIEVITAPGFKPAEALEQYVKGNIKGYESCTSHGSDC